MPLHTQAEPDPATFQPARTPDEARNLADKMMNLMNALLKVVEEETELVRAGNVRDAALLESRKTELSRRYITMIKVLKASQAYLASETPDLLAGLHRHHDTFRAMLQVNLTVLATAHAVSEGIVRGVNAEIQRRNSPQTYTARGQRAMPVGRNVTPIVVNRSM
jgi:hypothetical protein